jgi:hypothetical protein
MSSGMWLRNTLQKVWKTIMLSRFYRLITPETPPDPPPVQPASLTGDVYELTVADAQGVVISDHLRGQIYLTNTYRVESVPFITIPISRELSDHFAAQRRQIM